MAERTCSGQAHADCYCTYGGRSERVPGTIDVRGNGTTRRWVVNLHGQVYGGGPNAARGDSHADRERFFAQGLQTLAQHITSKHDGGVSVAFPHQIGCGLARGNWGRYACMLQKFTEDVNRGRDHAVHVTVYKLRGDEQQSDHDGVDSDATAGDRDTGTGTDTTMDMATPRHDACSSETKSEPHNAQVGANDESKHTSAATPYMDPGHTARGTLRTEV